MFIYKTTNLVNGKIYIGLHTKNDPNYIGSGTAFKKALKKFGTINFKREILENCKTIAELIEREMFWIEKYNSTNPKIGYNIRFTKKGKAQKSKVTFKHKTKDGDSVFVEELKKTINKGKLEKSIIEYKGNNYTINSIYDLMLLCDKFKAHSLKKSNSLLGV